MLRPIILCCFSFPLSCLAQVPVACFPFNAGDPGDATGNGYDGSVNGALPTADRFGNQDHAYWFDGTDDRVELPTLGEMITGNEFSVSLWLKADLSAAHAAILMIPDSADDRLCVAPQYNHTSGNSVFWDYGNIFTTGRVFVNPYAFSSAWDHWVFVHSEVNDHMDVFVNGTLLRTEAQHSAIMHRERAIWIGGGPGVNGGNLHFNGAIDDVMFFNAALDASAVASMYADQQVNTVCGVVGIHDAGVSQDPLIMLSVGSILVTWPQGSERGHVEVLDASGRVVCAVTGLTGQRWFVGSDALPSGVYVVRCTIAHGQFVGRVVVE